MPTRKERQIVAAVRHKERSRQSKRAEAIAQQPSLFDPPPDAPDAEQTLDAKFEEWIKKNDHLLAAFIERALAHQRAGRKVGAKKIAEDMRWDPAVMRAYGGEFKLNNNYTSRLHRRAVDVEPSLDGYFGRRKLQRED